MDKTDRKKNIRYENQEYEIVNARQLNDNARILAHFRIPALT